jgi:hypothetical protein
LVGRPVQVVQEESGGVIGRFASGTTGPMLHADLGRRVADAIPGVTEPCLVCGGEEAVPTVALKPEVPFTVEQVGTEPCPNCRGLH